jgi:hypothetical protein
MNPALFSFSFNDIKIETKLIETMMGYRHGAPEPFHSCIDETLRVVPEYCDIKGGYLIFDQIFINQTDKSIKIGNQFFFPKNIIIKQLKEVQSVAVFICTAGKKIGEWSKELMDAGDLIKGYVVDVIGSSIVETAMDLIHAELEGKMKKTGLGITNRYSPGYCGWDVVEQQKLFSLLPPGFCGVSLSASSLMTPIKSISGIIGIGMNAKRKTYTCNLCDDKNCLYRNKKS